MVDQWLRSPFIPSLQRQSQVCHSRSEFYSDEVWHGCELYREHFMRVGIDSWMIAVRYPSETTWSSITLYRAVGRADYSPVERALVDVVLASKAWLHFRLSSNHSRQSSELNSRNATILLLLLEGCSRKEIAAQIEVTLHIVNDSIKAIYRHFGTSSATELAAKFMKGA